MAKHHDLTKREIRWDVDLRTKSEKPTIHHKKKPKSTKKKTQPKTQTPSGLCFLDYTLVPRVGVTMYFSLILITK